MSSMTGPFGGSIPPVVKNLLIINGLLFLLKMSLGTDAMGRPILDGLLGMHYVGSPLFKPWQVVTHMFMHADLGHLFFNMFALFMFGGPVERTFGSKRFLNYYLITGFGAVALHTGVNAIEVRQNQADLAAYGVALSAVDLAVTESTYDVQSADQELQAIVRSSGAPYEVVTKVFFDRIMVMIGASGAVFGVLLAFGMLFPNAQLFLLFPPIPIKAKYFVIGYGVLELISGLSRNPDSNIAHFAHLGGMLFGFLLIKHWRKQGQLW
jgi:membrane associated rhomboid family serine protease